MHGKNRKTAVLVAGGDASDFRATWSQTPKNVFIIAVDHGVDILMKEGILPDLLVGDMDSTISNWRELPCEKIFLSPQKDDTDTEMAINVALERGYENILLIGGIGNRLDHTLGNIEVLTGIFLRGFTVSMASGSTSIYWVDADRPLSLSRREGRGVSLLPIRGDALGVETEGLLYPLKGEVLYENLSRGISNEWSEEEGSISLKSGMLLVILYKKE